MKSTPAIVLAFVFSVWLQCAMAAQSPPTTNPAPLVVSDVVATAKALTPTYRPPSKRQLWMAAGELAKRHAPTEADALLPLARQGDPLALFVLLHFGRSQEALEILWKEFDRTGQGLLNISYAPREQVRAGLHQRTHLLDREPFWWGAAELLAAVGDERSLEILRETAAKRAPEHSDSAWAARRIADRLAQRLAMDPVAARRRADDELAFWQAEGERDSRLLFADEWEGAAELHAAGIRLSLDFLLEMTRMPPDTPPELISWWGWDSQIHKATAILAYQKEERAVPRLLEMVAKDERGVSSALAALRMIASPACLRPLEEFVRPGQRFIWDVTGILGDIGDATTLDVLRRQERERRYSPNERLAIQLCIWNLEERLEPLPDGQRRPPPEIPPEAVLWTPE